jgi:hypothetical protein
MSSVEAPARYLSPSQIAVLLNVHDNTVNRWCRDGVRFSDGRRRRPELIRTPGGWRIREDHLWQFLDAVKADRTAEPSDAPEATRSARGARIEQMEAGFAAIGL